MEPIISPWWFYLVGIVGYIGTTLRIGALALGCLVAVVVFDCEKSTEKICIWVGVAAAIMLLLSAFIPDRQTAYTMLAASVITPDNIQAAQGNIVDFIMNVAKSIQEVK